MVLKHYDVLIDLKTPFLNCKLNRENYAQVLTGILRNHSDGFVMAINNEWGTGKTTFIKMWEQYLKNEEFKTLYFNAWDNDFENDVLVALISELQELKEQSTNNSFSGIIKKAAPLTKDLAIGIAKTRLEKYTGKEFAQKALNITDDSISIHLEEQIKLYKHRKQSIIEFKKSLENFVSQTKGNNPLVFFIDELDRCRPSYAVEVLEQVKQLFLVSGIIFVIAIDKTQLCHAIRGVYGNENINAEEYLRRFIDIEYSIPKPSTKEFCNYLYEYFQFSDFFKSNLRIQHQVFQDDGESFLKFSTMLFNFGQLPLRVQEKIYAHSRLALSSFRSDHYVVPNLFVLLIYLKFKHFVIYDGIKNVSFSIQELIDAVENVLPENLNDYNLRTIIYTEAILLMTYCNLKDSYQQNALLHEDHETRKLSLPFKSKIDKSQNNQVFIEMIQSISRNGRINYYELSISHLITRIELTEIIHTPTKEFT